MTTVKFTWNIYTEYFFGQLLLNLKVPQMVQLLLVNSSLEYICPCICGIGDGAIELPPPQQVTVIAMPASISMAPHANVPAGTPPTALTLYKGILCVVNILHLAMTNSESMTQIHEVLDD